MPTKRLYRSRDDQILGGVCAGIARYFDVDPTLVRLIFIAAFLAGGAGLLAYIVAWIIVPEEPVGHQLVDMDLADDIGVKNNGKNGERANYILGLAFIGIGVYFLMGNLLPRLDIGEYFWPAALIIAGAYLLTRKS